MLTKRSFAAIALTGLITGAITTPVHAQPNNEPQEEEIGLLFAHTAERGKLEPTGTDGVFILTLRDVARQVVWFSDRPVRHSGQIPLRRFVRAWEGFGFTADPPNAALTLLGADEERDTVIVELRVPRSLKRPLGVRYRVRFISEATGNLSHFEQTRDERVPRRFSAASLFVDDASGQVINNCVIQPYTLCDSAQLDNANLSGTDLSNAILGGASLTSANLQNASFADAWLEDADLQEADAAGANFAGAFLYGANLHSANLRGANLTGTTLHQTDLTLADLTGADISGADLTGATFCETTMPDGSIRSDSCPIAD